MAFKLLEKVQETSTTTGLGTLTLLGAVGDNKTFSSQMSNNDTTLVTTSDNTDIEICIGTYTNTSGQQISRGRVLYSTNGGALVNWGVGTRNVFVGIPGKSLASLVDPSAGTGMLVQTADETWARRSLAVGSGLVIANASGVTGNPTISAPASMRFLGTTTFSAATNPEIAAGLITSEFDDYMLVLTDITASTAGVLGLQIYAGGAWLGGAEFSNYINAWDINNGLDISYRSVVATYLRLNGTDNVKQNYSGTFMFTNLNSTTQNKAFTGQANWRGGAGVSHQAGSVYGTCENLAAITNIRLYCPFTISGKAKLYGIPKVTS